MYIHSTNIALLQWHKHVGTNQNQRQSICTNKKNYTKVQHEGIIAPRKSIKSYTNKEKHTLNESHTMHKLQQTYPKTELNYAQNRSESITQVTDIW